MHLKHVFYVSSNHIKDSKIRNNIYRLYLSVKAQHPWRSYWKEGIWSHLAVYEKALGLMERWSHYDKEHLP